LRDPIASSRRGDDEEVLLATGELYPFLGIRLSPMFAAAAMALTPQQERSTSAAPVAPTPRHRPRPLPGRTIDEQDAMNTRMIANIL
jgi:hypothetical protein